MTPKQYKARLIKLADFLDALPRSKFDYAFFVDGDEELSLRKSCGSTGCALGWACTIPAFRKKGLKFIDQRVTFIDSKGRVSFTFDAGQSFFGLTEAEAAFLFAPEEPLVMGGKTYESPAYEATPKQVAKHLRQFANRKWPS